MIAHRLSTVVQADTILVLENGNITGTGTHEELMKYHPYYKKIVEQQFLIKKQKTRYPNCVRVSCLLFFL